MNAEAAAYDAEPATADLTQRKIQIALEEAVRILADADLKCSGFAIDPAVKLSPHHRNNFCPTLSRTKMELDRRGQRPVRMTSYCSRSNGLSFSATIENGQIVLCDKYAESSDIPKLARTFIHEAAHLADDIYRGRTNDKSLLECWANEVLSFAILFSGKYPVVTDDYPWTYDCWDFVNRMNQSIVPALRDTPVSVGMTVRLGKKLFSGEKIADADFPQQSCFVSGSLKTVSADFVSGKVAEIQFFPPLPLHRAYSIASIINLDFGALGSASILCQTDFSIWGAEKFQEISKNNIVFSGFPR